MVFLIFPAINLNRELGVWVTVPNVPTILGFWFVEVHIATHRACLRWIHVNSWRDIVNWVYRDTVLAPCKACSFVVHMFMLPPRVVIWPFLVNQKFSHMGVIPKLAPFQWVRSELGSVATVCDLWVATSLCNPSPQLTEIRPLKIELSLLPGKTWLANFAIALSQSILDFSRTDKWWNHRWQPKESISDVECYLIRRWRDRRSFLTRSSRSRVRG